MNLENKIKKVMGTILEVPETSINEDSSSDNLASWDSLRHMDLILALEEEFNVVIPDQDAADLTSYKLIKLTMLELGAKG